MIINKSVLLTINNKNIKHLQSKGYTNLVINNKIEILVEDLQKGSNVIVDVKCNNCDRINKIKYIKYNSLENGYYCKNCINIARSKSVLNKYGVDNVSKVKEIIDKKQIIITEEIKEKRKITCNNKYGVNNPMKCPLFKYKTKQTNMIKYGVDNPMKVDMFKKKLKETRILIGIQIPDELLTEYQLYRKEVDRITRSNKRILFDNWNGYDFYDGEYIKDNLKLHYNNRLYPTIDHKISVYKGYINNISPEIIGDISNLCITKLTINSQKGYK